MFCINCNMARAQDWTPCPHCGAASPLVTGSHVAPVDMSNITSMHTTNGAEQPWGNPTSFSPGQYQQYQQYQGQQQSLLPPSYQPYQSYQQGMQMPQMEMPPSGQPSLLPVPYQGGMRGIQGVPQGGFPVGGFPAGSLQSQLQGTARELMPLEEREKLLPALPLEEGGIVYVPPMYTKPRAIIPRYRAISGVLSIIIVSLLLCTGTGYYAKATGRLQYLQQVIGGVPPPSLPATPAPKLPEPANMVVRGPAYAVILSAVVTKHVDPNNPFFARQPDVDFVVGDTIYVIYSVQPQKAAGVVVTKWYTDNHFYSATTSRVVKAGLSITGNSQMKYAQPSEGKVELYWNNQLAQTLYFVVRAAP